MNCRQQGCAGVIVDGYCGLCGLAPPRTSEQETPAAGASRPRRTLAPRETGTQTARSATTIPPRSGATRSSTGASRFGAGLVEPPAVSLEDPSSAVMAEPTVRESTRFCARCDQPVGRAHNGSSGRSEGFCRRCGTRFSFTPKLSAGDVVAGQYEVFGPLAHGGMGWIYLARDRYVADRWVVLKGLLNTADEDAVAAALGERRFLAEVEHPNIVKIYNFVQHESSGYIVMEYVGGASLKQVLSARRETNGDRPDPLPVAQAIAYIVEILPALGYLHGSGLLFCDFKLDNVIQTQHSLKLIDLGGVYRMDDRSTPVYGTVGYQAPEITETGPSIASDLFTVARTLALLCTDFRGYQSTFEFTLPAQDSVPLFTRFDSLYRVLSKGTAADPHGRFQSAEEMADQLIGVLREVVAEEEGRPVAAPSTLFTGDFRADPDRPDWRLLPVLQVAGGDPAAGYLATLATTDAHELVALLRAAPVHTLEVDLRIARALIDAGDFAGAQALLAPIEASDARQWRAGWYRGVIELATDRLRAAGESFSAVYRAVPGELAPKLALGVTAECAGDPQRAGGWYEVVSRTNPAYTTATFGLARCRLAAGDRAGALGAYARVPESSSAYIDAQTARIRCLIGPVDGDRHELGALRLAGSDLDSLSLAAEQRARLTADLLQATLRLLEQGEAAPDPDAQLLGHRLVEGDLRIGLERSYRDLARRARNHSERIRLVDSANRVRPTTWT